MCVVSVDMVESVLESDVCQFWGHIRVSSAVRCESGLGTCKGQFCGPICVGSMDTQGSVLGSDVGRFRGHVRVGSGVKYVLFLWLHNGWIWVKCKLVLESNMG